MKKTLDQISLKNKKVIIRVDFNVPIVNGIVTSNKRIEAVIPTIKKVVNEGGKAILMSHLGRVKSEEDLKKKSLAPVVEILVNLLGMPITFVPATNGTELEETINSMKSGEIVMMENTRFEDLNNDAESSNNPDLGMYWASLGDVFINDAFGTVHRKHASNVGISTYIAESGIGYLVEKEIKNLDKALSRPERPIVAILGGAKVSDKIGVLNNLLKYVDKIIIGGAMAYTFLAAQGIGIGKSLVEEDKIDLAREYLKNNLDKFVLPIDYALAKDFEDVKPFYNLENTLEIPNGYMGLDIGPKSIEVFKKYIKDAKTILWNGPLGVTEFKYFKEGTKAIAKAITELKGNVYTVVGGGDSVAIIEELGLDRRFSHVSTGGGATLEFLEGKELPGIQAIQNEGELGRTKEEIFSILTQNSEEVLHEHTAAFSTSEVEPANEEFPSEYNDSNSQTYFSNEVENDEDFLLNTNDFPTREASFPNEVKTEEIILNENDDEFDIEDEELDSLPNDDIKF
ncbi:phosphoglycerate kinase [Mycoplasma mobile 163K]|uniref:Phosphoglycerate kinase n=1 Tax=Mycoplasma mobile (strain ATCC 43663 / 163K / NCTC 11711) TaxID=267748 RepID=Q6KHJ1_MYCM1|nr:phosphoglycerate kinase [[Mycoplasma] mobile]AAT27939.1 phosphoglycerate kinase [Mycoplasma mobile 163K]